MSKKRVNTAFEILLEQIEYDVNDLQEEGAQSIKNGNYKGVRGVIEDAEEVTRFRQKVKLLQGEWRNLKLTLERSDSGNSNHHPRGLRTPDEAFRKPILESILELGGHTEMGPLLQRLEQKMQGGFNDYDREVLSDTPRVYRWQNTANWCRNALASEGYLNNNTNKGVWEITPKGKKALQEGRINVTGAASARSESSGRKPGVPRLPKPGMGGSKRVSPPGPGIKRPA